MTRFKKYISDYYCYQTCVAYCKERIIPGLASKSINPVDYLNEFLVRWKRYDTLITWLDKLCDYIVYINI